MTPSLTLAASAMVAAGVAGAIRLGGSPEPFSGGPAALLAADILLLTLIAVAGMLLARARWSRRLAQFLAAFQVGLVALSPLDAAGYVAAGLAIVAGAATLLPSVGRNLRRLSTASSPPPEAVLLLLGLMAYPGLLAVAQPSDIGAVHYVAAAVTLATAFAFSRGGAGGLWSVRIGLPVAGAAAAAVTALPGSVVVATATALLAVLSWARAVALAAVPLLPSPVAGFRIPPELAPPEVLEAAGLDERGRKRR